MEKIVYQKNTPYKSVNWDRLDRQTTKIGFEKFNATTFQWNIITEIHFLGCENPISDEDNIDVTNDEDRFGIYYSIKENWMLIYGNRTEEYLKYLKMCGIFLRHLDIRFTKCIELELTSINRINILYISNNSNLEKLHGFQLCNHINTIDLSKTSIQSLPNLSIFPYLRSIGIRETEIEEIILDSVHQKLKYIDMAKSNVSDCSFISQLPFLKRLNMSFSHITELPSLVNNLQLESLYCSHTKIEQLPSLNHLTDLRSINIGYTNISDVENSILPTSLRTLVLEGTEIKKIPRNIVTLINLRRLVLCDMQLDTLPTDILDLNLEFNMTNKGYGICLSDTVIKEFDVSLLKQPRQIIESWFRNRDKEIGKDNVSPLNEMKVVFLGDGGAGKSLSIYRLLNDGDIPNGFDGNSTPGISINTRYYNIGKDNILVHFWDFGGQEIMHSMHRMFLTKRTLYIVFVNARDNTQDERARYWLHNIKTFAEGSKVILVLNQIDQNPSASVNEPALRDLYPNLVTIIKLSATVYQKEEFNNTLTNNIINEIGKISHINQPFLHSWNRLKHKLQNMKEYYIDAETYKEMSEECGVLETEEIRVDLLDWFSDLGISFCYRDSSALSNYMILRPDWITNAIYIILFNGFNKSQNGLIRHDDIHEMLSTSPKNGTLSKRVISDISYSPVETEYVLGVIRKFKLSYRIDDETEFIPMLCDRNENAISKDFVGKEDVLEFHMEYAYLPNNVIHRLMVEMRNDLVHEYVWLTGAVFLSDDMGLKALAKIEDCTLKLFVISNNELYPANVYLGFIRSVIHNINDSLGLSASEVIIYKREGLKDRFAYDYLIDSYKHGNKHAYSMILKKNILIIDILNQSDGYELSRENKMIDDIIDACLTMQANKLYWKCSENERNTCMRDLLRQSGYIIADQTLSGKSESGINPGELDFMIMETSKRPIALYEALKLSSFSNTSKRNWDKHLLKLLDNYNPIGLPLSFLVSYVECTKDKFKEFWIDYYDYLSQNSNSKYLVQKVIEREDKTYYLRSVKCIYDRAGIPTTVYHIVARFGD